MEVSKNFQFSAFQYRHRLRRFVCAAERQKDEDRRVIKQEKTKGRGIGDDGGRRESRNEWYSVYSGLSYVVRYRHPGTELEVKWDCGKIESRNLPFIPASPDLRTCFLLFQPMVVL